ncbi:MAG TPA: hypothetical protein VK388_18130 [Pyrinomonadaceae bacterium]|nr:hypothetical protein [Pyrinomonadaceae bacterium]
MHRNPEGSEADTGDADEISGCCVGGGARLARVFEVAPPASGRAGYDLFERQAAPLDPQGAGAPQRDIRNSTVEPPLEV